MESSFIIVPIKLVPQSLDIKVGMPLEEDSKSSRFLATVKLQLLGKVKVAQSCLTLCHPMDHSLPGSSVHGILQARILEWVIIPFSRGSSCPRNQNWGSLHCRQILYQLSYQGSPFGKDTMLLDTTHPENLHKITKTFKPHGVQKLGEYLKVSKGHLRFWFTTMTKLYNFPRILLLTGNSDPVGTRAGQHRIHQGDILIILN